MPATGESGRSPETGLAALRAAALEMAALVRPLALRYFRQPLQVEHKSDQSPVTVADRGIEAALRQFLAMHFPDHGIFGEEQGAAGLQAPYVWVIDPIDGTKAFISGMPLFGTLIACLKGGRPALGVIDMPALGETWVGQDGMPTLFNGKPCHARGDRLLADVILYTTSPDNFVAGDASAFARLRQEVGLCRYGGDCYPYGLLASGHVDLVIEAGLQPYDYLALVAVIEGAGGVITDWRGQPLGLGSDGRVVAAGSAELHRWALAELGPP